MACLLFSRVCGPRRLRRQTEPPWLGAQGGAKASSAKVTPTELAEARNNVRTTLLQGLGGFVLLVGAYLTWRQTRSAARQP
jgi:hypothetical protein